MSPSPPDAVRMALLRAIWIEARNATIYDSLFDVFDGNDDEVSAIFREMAAEERQHGAKLEAGYRERFGPVPTLVDEPKEVIESPDLDDPESFLFDSMNVEQALSAGLRAEEEARGFYTREATLTSDPGLRALYAELAEFEESHVRVLNEKRTAYRTQRLR